MNPDRTRTRARFAPLHRITWFAPERPVENGTVHVRPEPDPEPDAKDQVTQG